MLGSYAFSINLHDILHELGHGVAVWVQGGTITGFHLHPFESCYAYSTYVPDHILLYAGGALFGGLSTLAFPVVAWHWRTPYAAALVTACAAGLGETAFHMLTDHATGAATDYTYLVGLGVPVGLILLAGTAFLVLSVLVRILFLPLLGVSYEMGIPGRLLVFEFGILPYGIAAGAYAIMAQDAHPISILAGLIVMAVVLALEAILSWFLPGWWGLLRRIEPVQVRPRHLLVVWLSAALLIAMMFVVSVSPPSGA
jgi:hypothetical protein